MPSKYSKEILENLVKNNFTLADVIRGLDLKPNGGNYKHIKNLINYYELSTKHFLGTRHNKGKSLENMKNTRSYDEIIKENQEFCLV